MRTSLSVPIFLIILTDKTLGVSQFSTWWESQPKINIEGAIERFLNALGEYYEAGGIESVKRSFQIDEGEVKVPRVRVFGLEEAENSPYNVFCFRIPAVVQTDSGTVCQNGYE